MYRSLKWLLAMTGTTVLLVALMACTSSTGEQQVLQQAQVKLKVVATTALLADMVKNVGGDLIQVRTIVPPGADAHSFQPLPADSVTVNAAAMFVSNGGGLDNFLRGMLETAAASDAIHVIASDGLIETTNEKHDGHSDEEHNGHSDPHFWQNPVHAIHYARQIRDGLSTADSENSATYFARAETYIEDLAQLDQDMFRILEQVPTEKRHIFSFHDAFGHLAARYDWEMSSLVHSDASTVTPSDIVALIQSAADNQVAAVFAEPQFGSGILERAAEEAGVKVGLLYSDALDDEVTSYIAMMRFNAQSLVEHLK